MTQKEFSKTSFERGMKAIYAGNQKCIAAVDFCAGTIGLVDTLKIPTFEYDIDWVPCIFVEIVK